MLWFRPANAEDALTLEHAYELAVERFERVQSADVELERAKLAPYRALTTVVPSVNLTGSYTREKEEIEFDVPPEAGSFFGDSPVILPEQVGRGLLEVRQTLWTFQLPPLWRAAQLEITASGAARKIAIQETASAVARSFFDVLRARAQLGVAKETLQLSEAEQRRARLRHEVGEIVKTDVLRAEVTTAQARQLLTASANEVRLAEIALGRLVGLEIGELSEPSPLARPAVNLDSAQALAEEERPDLARQRTALEGAEEEEKRRFGALLPTLGAEWRYRLTSEETFAERNNFWTAIVSLRLPLFDRGGAPFVELQEQKRQVEQAQIALRSLRRDVRVEVERAWLELDTLTANLLTASDEQRLAAETHALVSKQYDAGSATSLEVTTALTERQRAAARLVNLRAAHAVATVNLRRATGVLAGDTGLMTE